MGGDFNKENRRNRKGIQNHQSFILGLSVYQYINKRNGSTLSSFKCVLLFLLMLDLIIILILNIIYYIIQEYYINLIFILDTCLLSGSEFYKN